MSLYGRFRDWFVGRPTAMSGLASPPAPGLEPLAQDHPIGSADSPQAKALRSPDALFGRATYGAGPSPTRFSSYIASGVEPQTIWSAQQQRNNGYPYLWADLNEQTLERDGHLGGVYDTRRQNVSDKKFRIHSSRRGEPVAETVAKITERAIDRCENFDRAVEDLLSATAYGYALSEIVWGWSPIRFQLPNGRRAEARLMVPKRIEWVHWKHVRFDRYTDEPYLWLIGGGEQPLPPNKFVFHTAGGTGLVERGGFMPACVWLSAAKRWSERDWLVYAKIFGIPQILAQFPNGEEEYQLHRDQYVQFLKDWGEGIPALLPDNLQVNISREAAGRSGDIHGSIIGWANAEISKRVLGSTLTVEMGGQGSWAAADTHRDAPFMRARSDAKKLAATFHHQLFKPIIELNVAAIAAATGFAPDDLLDSVSECSWRIERELNSRDRLEAYKVASDYGYRVSKTQFSDEFALDEAFDDEDLLPGQVADIAGSGAVIPTAQAAKAEKPVTVAGEGKPPPDDNSSQPPAPEPAGEERTR